MLAVTDTASGFGLEDDSGTQLAVNVPAPQLSLNDGTTKLIFRAYVQSKSEAITKQTIVNGDFTSTETFEMNHE